MTDAPPLFGEDWLSAQLLEIMCKHCGTTGTSWIATLSRFTPTLMALCEEAGLIEITGERGGRIFDKVRPEGRALLEWLRRDRERDRTAQP